jgi:ComF family protein
MNNLYRASGNIISNLCSDLLDLFYPPVCGLCDGKADIANRLVCKSCLDKIVGPKDPYCIECKQLLQQSLRCQHCQKQTMPIFSLGYHEGDVRTLVHDLKFQGLKPLAGPLGYKLAELIYTYDGKLKIDFIIPVPLHSGRKYQRGFNQAEEIAKAMGHKSGIQVLPEALYLTRRTRQQARLPAAQRYLNVKDAFAVDIDSKIIYDKTILLVDDVTTTGATLLENTRVLKSAGAKKVVAAVVATAA